VANTIKQFPDLSFESSLWAAGIQYIAGLDEAGRGAWAGPVAAGAVILPDDPDIKKKLHGVRDSKQMTARQRTLWAETIKTLAVSWSVGLASNIEIDELGILPATRLAMTRALKKLKPDPEHLLIDALKLPEIAIPQGCLIKGDARVLSIAAASVLAKTARDAWMVELDKTYPVYGFARNKAYGTALHHAALREAGPCPEHRFSYAPIRRLASSPAQSSAT
jgi:ribonuclease HII